MKVLIVEDDEKLASVLLRGLKDQRCDGARARDFAEGRQRLLFGEYDVVVLDISLPGGSGIDLCREARRRGITTPILMLTARDAIDDRVLGLESGADDYLTKPFAFRELTARLDALGRRQPALRPSIRRIADLEIDFKSHRVVRAGRAVALTSKEFTLLELFALHENEMLDRAAITARVWDENHDPFSKVIEVLIARLRKKIDDGHEPKLIHTFRGAGYRFGLEAA